MVKEFEKKPDDPMLKKWVETMTQKYGNWQSWPKRGCDSWFTPWAKGMSMVVEVKCANGGGRPLQPTGAQQSWMTK